MHQHTQIKKYHKVRQLALLYKPSHTTPQRQHSCVSVRVSVCVGSISRQESVFLPASLRKPLFFHVFLITQLHRKQQPGFTPQHEDVSAEGCKWLSATNEILRIESSTMSSTKSTPIKSLWTRGSCMYMFFSLYNQWSPTEHYSRPTSTSIYFFTFICNLMEMLFYIKLSHSSHVHLSITLLLLNI